MVVRFEKFFLILLIVFTVKISHTSFSSASGVNHLGIVSLAGFSNNNDPLAMQIEKIEALQSFVAPFSDPKKYSASTDFSVRVIENAFIISGHVKYSYGDKQYVIVAGDESYQSYKEAFDSYYADIEVTLKKLKPFEGCLQYPDFTQDFLKLHVCLFALQKIIDAAKMQQKSECKKQSEDNCPDMEKHL